MKKKKPLIGIIGPNKEKCNNEIYSFAYRLGVKLSDLTINIASGGKLGIMEAVFKGIKSQDSCKSITVGIIPEENNLFANDYCDIVIPTGIGTARNKIVINSSDIIIAIAGGAGTLSEIAFAWQMNKPVIACTLFDGWAKKLAGEIIDQSNNSPIIEANSINQIITLLKNQLSKLDLYKLKA